MKYVFLIFFALSLFCKAQDTEKARQTDQQNIVTSRAVFSDSGKQTGNYGNNEDYSVTYTSKTGKPFQVMFYEVDIEDQNDKLYIYDGADKTAPLLKVITGKQLVAPILTSGKNITFEFVSNASVTGKGWKASIISVPEKTDSPSFRAGLKVDITTYTPDQLIQDILINGCVKAFNVKLNKGKISQIGYFDGQIANPPVQFQAGVILASGDAKDAEGPNNNGSNGNQIDFSGTTDADLNILCGDQTIDPCVLEFDFVPQSDTIRFSFQFGSEEYLEWVNTGFNDVFGFFLSGPGITGPFTNNAKNIGLVNGQAITINNINDQVNNQYYQDNEFGPGVTNCQYDGMTTELVAESKVTPCMTYHIKLAIADVGDGAYDSGVLLKKGSFSDGSQLNIILEDDFMIQTKDIYEGCGGCIIFERTDDQDITKDVPIKLIIKGTATQGVDYNYLPTDTILKAGEKSIKICYETLFESPGEGNETIIIETPNLGCPCNSGSETQINIINIDPINATISATEDSVCAGKCTNLSVNLTAPDESLISYYWNETNQTTKSINVCPTTTTTYHVDIKDRCSQKKTLSFTVNVLPKVTVSNVQSNCDFQTSGKYGVHFDINGKAPYKIWGNGIPGTFNPPGSNKWESGPITSEDTFNIYITDKYGCDTIHLTGVEDCGCGTYSGTMKIDTLVTLCEDECITAVNNGDQYLEPGPNPAKDVLEYFMHTSSGKILGTVLEHNKTGYFCFKPSLGMQYNTIYYISAVAGLDNNGQVDLSMKECLSVAYGTPVMWLQNPIADAGSGGETCSNTFQLHAINSTGKGSWTSSPTAIFTPSFNDPNAVITMTVPGVIYTLTWTVYNGKCSDVDNIQVTYNETPVAYAGKDDKICGNEYTFSGSASVGTGTWSGGPPGTTFNPAASNPSALVHVPTYGPQVFKWTVDNKGCKDDDFVVITFMQLPTPDAGAADTVCFGANVSPYQLNALSNKGVGKWTGPLGTYFFEVDSPSTLVDPPSFTTPDASFWFKWTENNDQCSGSDSVRITFAKTPIAKAGQSQIKCGSELCLKANILGSEFAIGTWTSVPGVQFDSIHSPKACANIINEGVFGDTSSANLPFYWVMDNMGCTNVDTVWNFFYQRPEAEAWYLKKDTVSECGLEFTMHAVLSIDSSQGEWTVVKYPSNINPAGVKLKNKYDTKTNVIVPDSGYYTFVWMEENTLYPVCSSTDTLVIRFMSKPDIFAGYDTTVCGDSIKMKAISDFGTGEWIENLDVWMKNKNNPKMWTGPVDGADDKYYEYIWKEYNGPCVSTDTVKIYFGRIPEPLVVNKSPMYNCGLTTTYNNQLKALTQYGYNGYWKAPATSGEIYNPDSSELNVYVTVPDYGKHTFYRYENNNGCIGQSDGLDIYFIEIPQADAGGGLDNADTACGLNFDLHALPSVPGAIGTWSTECNAVFKSTGDETSNLPNDSIKSNKYQTCILIWTEDNSHGCVDSDILKLTFASIPNNQFTWEMPDCVGDTALIMGAGALSLPPSDTLPNYTWYFGEPGTYNFKYELNAKNGMSRCWVHWTDGKPFHAITLTTTNSFGCSSITKTDTVWEPPVLGALFSVAPDTCNYGKGELTVIPNGGTAPNKIYKIEWTPPSNFSDPKDLTQSNLFAGDYTVKILDENFCVSYVSVNLPITGLVFADFLPTLPQKTVPVEVIFNNNTINGGTYIWNFGDGTDPSYQVNPTHIYTEDGDSIKIILIATSPEGCMDTAYYIINLDATPLLDIPNIFTPNNDGKNDYFQVFGSSLKTFEGKIFNRWGKQVYEWTDWQKEEAGWNGKIKGTGDDASPGVYFYIIKATGMDAAEEKIEAKGAFQLVREK